MIVTACLAAIGFLDDWRKLRKARPLKIREKFVAQTAVGLGLGAYLYRYPTDAVTTQLVVPFAKDWVPDLGAWYIVVVAVVVVGSSNAVNLTDGLDGLAIGPVVIAAGHLRASWRTSTGRRGRSPSYLRSPSSRRRASSRSSAGPSSGRRSAFSGSTAIRPRSSWATSASLSLGAAIAAVAVLTKQELLLADRRRAVRGRGALGHHPGRLLQDDRASASSRWRRSTITSSCSAGRSRVVIMRFWILAMLFAVLALSTLKLR